MRRRTLLAAAIISGCAMEMGCSATNGPSGGSGISEGASDSQAAAIKKMELATGNAWSVSYDSFLGTPYHAAGSTQPVLKSGISPSQAALSFLAENKEVFGMEDPAAELSSLGDDADEFGWRHANLEQRVGGVPVYGGSVLVHYDTEGAIRSVGAHYLKGIRQLDINPTVTTKEALATAIRDWKANFQATLDEKKDFDREPEIGLYIYDRDGKAALAWWVQVNVIPSDTHDPAKISYWIDAKTGAIIHKYNGLPTTAAKGSGTDNSGNKRELDIDSTGTSFSLTDSTRPSGKITTYNLKGATSGTGTLFTATAADGPWDTSETAPNLGSGVGAHYYSEAVWDYYKTIHGRDSMNGKGQAMINRVHYSKNWANASWDGTYMNYGDGDNTQLRNLTKGFDVIAHELTHGVTENTSKLAYTGQPGALNESMSDIFGNLSEHWLQPSWNADIMANPNLAVGEDVGVAKALRYMCAPKKGLSAQVDVATDVTSSTEVHSGSGAPNVAWCLMTIGGTHPSTSVKVSSGIGWDKSAKVWYLTQTKFLAGMANATLAQAAKGNSDAATELGLTQNEKNIIQCAWIANKTLTTPTTCADTTGGDGPDGGTTKGDSGTTTPPDSGTTPDVRTDTPVPPADVSNDRPTVDINVPDTPPQPDVVTPPDAGTPDVTTPPDATGGRGGSSGTGGSGGGGTSGTGGSGGSTGGTGGSTGGTGGATGGTGGSTGGTAGAGTAGTGTGGTGRGGSTSTGSGGSGPSDPGCGCTIPGQSAPSTKSTLALAVGLVAAAISRRRRRNAA